MKLVNDVRAYLVNTYQVNCILAVNMRTETMASLKRNSDNVLENASSKKTKAEDGKADVNGNGTNSSRGKKHILLNAFDMSTVGHLSPGQWKNPKDKSATKRGLDYWIDLAKLLEKGDINALFLADTYGGYDTYEGSLDNCIRRAAQWPVTDPTIVSKSTRWTKEKSCSQDIANLGNGSSDYQSCLRHNSIHLFRTALPPSKTLQHSGPFDQRPHWLEYCYLLEKGCVQGYRYLDTNRA